MLLLLERFCAAVASTPSTHSLYSYPEKQKAGIAAGSLVGGEGCLGRLLGGRINDFVHEALDFFALGIGELIGGDPVLAERVSHGTGDFGDRSAARDGLFRVLAAVVIEIALGFLDVADHVSFA